MNMINENSTSQYSWGCVMLNITSQSTQIVYNYIREEDLYIEEGNQTFGLEDEPHITLLYGLYPEITVYEVHEIVSQYSLPEKIMLYNLSIFDAPKYDVLKFDIQIFDPNFVGLLEKLNRDLKTLKHKPSEFNYNPHSTVAFLKKGTSDFYINHFSEQLFIEFPINIVFSTSNKKFEIKI